MKTLNEKLLEVMVVPQTGYRVVGRSQWLDRHGDTASTFTLALSGGSELLLPATMEQFDRWPGVGSVGIVQ